MKIYYKKETVTENITHDFKCAYYIYFDFKRSKIIFEKLI